MREADGFLSAETLGLTPGQRAAMIKFKEMGKRGALVHHTDPIARVSADIDRDKFNGHVNMDVWARHDWCGTVCCIGGAIELMSRESLSGWEDKLDRLFHPPCGEKNYPRYEDITPSQMTQAVTNFLTDGEANWEVILEQ